MSRANCRLNGSKKPVVAAVLCATMAVIVAVAGRSYGAEPGSPQIPITVQPNLGDIENGARVEFGPDGKFVAVGDSNQIKLWDVASGRPLRILEHAAYFENFTFIEQGSQILSLHKGGEARSWDPATGRLVSSTRINAIEPGNAIKAMAHYPAHNLVVVTPFGNPIVIWDYKRKEARGAFVFDGANKTNPNQ